MPVEKFTAQWVERLKAPATGRIDWWDKKGTGLGLRISFTGSKVWQVRYRNAAGERRRVTLGEYPVVTLADANQRATEVLLQAAREKDPAAEKAARKSAPTVEELATDYLEKHVVPNLRPKTQKNHRQALRADIVRVYGKRKATEIKRRDIVGLLDEIAQRGAPGMAAKVLLTFSAMYNWALSRDLVEANPCHMVKAPVTKKPRSRWLSEDELRAVWAASEQEKPLSRALFRLCLLTGQRGGEVRQMRWVDVDGDWWTIPGHVAKNGLEHRVPLVPQAVALLNEVRQLGRGGPWIFTRNDKTPISSLEQLSLRIRKRSGIDHTTHDLRRTVASHMAQLGIREEAIGKVLNHTKASVTGKHYIHHTYDAEKRAALNDWAMALHTLISRS